MLTTPLPRLRHDVTVSRQGEAAVIRDDARRRFFRLGPVECFLLERCDGVTTVDEALAAAERQFDASLPRKALQRFLDSLRRAGLFESANGESARPTPARRRLRGNPLYLRIPLVDPDRALGWLARRSRFLYTRTFVVLSLCAILAAVVIAIAGWPDIVHDARSRLYRLSALPAIWFTVLAVVAAHEGAHALTCKHFGGEVHEMGFMLIYLQPAAYCNVSDAWLFPDKRHRLLVTLAGPYFELCLWALATLAWRVTDPESAISFLALIVVATSGLKTFINLNPFLKLDGYYLLSDALEIPNLRRRGFRMVADRFRAWFGRPTADPGELTPREHRILLAYGSVAMLLSLAFLGFAVAKLGRYVVQDRMLTFAMALGLLGMKLPRRVARMFGKGDPDGLDEDEDADVVADAPSEPAHRNGKPAPPELEARTPHGAAPAPPGRARAAAMWLAGGALAVAALAAVPAQLKVRGPFLALPRHNADVRTLVDGIVDQVCVEEGQAVQPGDVLARLSTTDVDAQLGDLEAQIATGRARLALLEAGPRREDVEVAAAAVATAEGHLPYARDRLAMNRSLSASGIISKLDLRLSEEQAVTAEHQVTEARKRLSAVSRGPRPEETAATRAEIAALAFRQQVLEAERQRLQITSPAAGVVATPALQLHDLLHQDLKKGDLVAEVYDTRVLTAEIAVPEQDIADVRVGQPVLLKARARPDLTFRGTVTSIGVIARAGAGAGSTASASSSSGAPGATEVTAKRVIVRTQIDNRALLLRPEMTGEAKIVCGRRSALSLFTRGLARTFRVEFWSWS